MTVRTAALSVTEINYHTEYSETNRKDKWRGEGEVC